MMEFALEQKRLKETLEAIKKRNKEKEQISQLNKDIAIEKSKDGLIANIKRLLKGY